MSEMPLSRKKSQNTGAVNSTIALKPPPAQVPMATRARATTHCSRRACSGAPRWASQCASQRRADQSQPSA